MSKRIVTVDVCEDIENGREPFSKIMTAATKLKSHQKLRLIAPFKPAPLLAILATQGFSHQATFTADGHWEVVFARERNKV